MEDVEMSVGPRRSSRQRSQTQKAALLSEARSKAASEKDARRKAMMEKAIQKAKSEEEFDDLANMLSSLGVGGRKRKTRKSKKKASKKTRKH